LQVKIIPPGGGFGFFWSAAGIAALQKKPKADNTSRYVVK
jgi:hypothetical protein